MSRKQNFTRYKCVWVLPDSDHLQGGQGDVKVMSAFLIPGPSLKQLIYRRFPFLYKTIFRFKNQPTKVLTKTQIHACSF